MFTGLIEEIAKIENIEKTTDGTIVVVYAPKLSFELKIGESVAINGACSTVTQKTDKSFFVEYSNHSLSVTTIKEFKKGTFVNIERAVKLSDRLGGHLVTGHVDDVTEFLSVIKDGFSYKYTFELPKEYANQIVKKGSITINGISLTVAECNNDSFSVAVIPHTQENTTLRYLKIGEKVNFETDLIGKYVELVLSNKTTDKTAQSKIDMQFLAEKGFI